VRTDTGRDDWDLHAAFQAIRRAIPWGDWDSRFPGMEENLRVALEATQGDLQWYESELVLAVEGTYGDECGVPQEVMHALPAEKRLAIVARLLENIALSYGVSLDKHGPGLNLYEDERTSPAGLLRALFDESWFWVWWEPEDEQ
jgi:hypothetical protein